ncbi:hypothetical protein BJP25_04500 [Actinokineospora bangkokensis]|uniref:Putative restriction endonuclease domain-containing protein n=1 Tax=Actinokineospora bangkokensis TaxID=1193682 RepID=A0A1Q9LDW0_9PSEU|nr:hypothetical protein BJP25_04500 [Actinokineospora bangkokensis]
MIAMPCPAQDGPEPHLLTIEEYAALGETERGYTELQEGCLLMSPSPSRAHMRVSARLHHQVEAQLPPELDISLEVDIDLRLSAPGEPSTSRRPDLIVYDRAAADRADREGTMLRAADVVLVVEVVSPTSRRMDRLIKPIDYAQAGIPDYWVVDPADGVSLIAHRLTDEGRYTAEQPTTGVFEAVRPFPVKVDLDALA